LAQSRREPAAAGRGDELPGVIEELAAKVVTGVVAVVDEAADVAMGCALSPSGAVRIARDPSLMTILYMRNRFPDHPIWAWVPGSRAAGYPLLDAVARGADDVLTGPEEARRTLAFLEQTGFRDSAEGTAPMPVEIVDIDGQPVAL
jgi:hypothetical protein